MNKEIKSFEYIVEITGAVITSINLITETNFINNDRNQVMLNGRISFLENYLNNSQDNEKDVKHAIYFNLFESLFIESQDSKFTFRDRVQYVFDILQRKESIVYTMIIDSIDELEIDISVRGSK